LASVRANLEPEPADRQEYRSGCPNCSRRLGTGAADDEALIDGFGDLQQVGLRQTQISRAARQRGVQVDRRAKLGPRALSHLEQRVEGLIRLPLRIRDQPDSAVQIGVLVGDADQLSAELRAELNADEAQQLSSCDLELLADRLHAAARLSKSCVRPLAGPLTLAPELGHFLA